MADALAEIDELAKQADTELGGVKSAADLEQYRIKWLGTKGILKSKMGLIGQAPPEQKKAVGQRLNDFKKHVETSFEARKQEASGPADADRDYVDVTEPGRRPVLGNRHIVLK